MKNRKSLYILIPLVLVVWGMVFWKVFLGSSGLPMEVSPVQALDKSEILDVKEEERVLGLNYPDPFLKERKTAKKVVSEPNRVTQRPGLNRVPLWPEIHYFGLVRNSSEHASLALLEINGRRYFVREGEKVDVVKCLSIHEDSIGVQLNDDQRYIVRTGSKQREHY